MRSTFGKIFQKSLTEAISVRDCLIPLSKREERARFGRGKAAIFDAQGGMLKRFCCSRFRQSQLSTVPFSDLRRRNFDLYGAALLAPQLTVVPALDQSGMLHLAGYIPTRPQQINFDLVFQVVGNRWRLYSISIATPEAAPAQPQAQAPPARSSTPAAHE